MANKSSPFIGITRVYNRVEEVFSSRGKKIGVDTLPDLIEVRAEGFHGFFEVGDDVLILLDAEEHDYSKLAEEIDAAEVISRPRKGRDEAPAK